MYDLHRAQEPQLGSMQTHACTPSLLPPLSLSPAPLPPFPQKFLRFLDSHEAFYIYSKTAQKGRSAGWLWRDCLLFIHKGISQAELGDAREHRSPLSKKNPSPVPGQARKNLPAGGGLWLAHCRRRQP